MFFHGLYNIGEDEEIIPIKYEFSSLLPRGNRVILSTILRNLSQQITRRIL